MNNIQPPAYKNYFIDLPLCRLNVLEVGQGAPLIMVPATISELEDWRTLAQFMAQWFHVYYFELPGHGKSEPFRERFSSQQVAGLLTQLADHLGLKKFNLMGFSFGGILAMQTFKHLPQRIESVILIAPCLDHRALPLSAFRRFTMAQINKFFRYTKVQSGFYNLIRNKYTISLIVKVFQKLCKLEETIPLKQKLSHINKNTISVLNAQIEEILNVEFDVNPTKFETPCYFAMSINDPLLCFDTTYKILQKHFSNVSSVQLTYPFHQPPVAFTYDELNRDFHETIETFVFARA